MTKLFEKKNNFLIEYKYTWFFRQKKLNIKMYF